MNRITVLMVTLTLLWGCGSMESPLNPFSVFKRSNVVLDNSTSDKTALIEGQSRHLGGICRVNNIVFDLDSVIPIYSIGRSQSLVVDAGPVMIKVSCIHETWDIFDGISSSQIKARFDFVAEAGHTYKVGHTYNSARNQHCMELLDATLNGRVIACERFYFGDYVDLTTTDDTALVTWELSPEKGNCSPYRGGRHKSTTHHLFKVDAGPVTIDAICIKSGFLGTKIISSFEFVAVAGHTYSFAAMDKECISLLDITSEEIVIACESYRKANRKELRNDVE